MEKERTNLDIVVTTMIVIPRSRKGLTQLFNHYLIYTCMIIKSAIKSRKRKKSILLFYICLVTSTFKLAVLGSVPAGHGPVVLAALP